MIRYFRVLKDFESNKIAFNENDIFTYLDGKIKFLSEGYVFDFTLYKPNEKNIEEIKIGDLYVSKKDLKVYYIDTKVFNGEILKVRQDKDGTFTLVNKSGEYVCDVGSPLFINETEKLRCEIPDENTPIGTIVESWSYECEADCPDVDKFLGTVKISGRRFFLTIDAQILIDDEPQLLEYSMLKKYCRIKKGE